jgi:hypothetical protein
MYFVNASFCTYMQCFDAILSIVQAFGVDRRTEFDAVTPSIMARRRAAPRRRIHVPYM